jgi:MFS family permease
MTTALHNRMIFVPKEKFPGWWVVGACFSLMFTSSALGFYGMAVYLNAFTKERDWEVGTLSLATSFFFLVSGVMSVFVARLISKYDVRIVVYAGALLGSVSLLFLGQVTQKWQLFAVYFLFGLAWSAVGLTPATTVVTRWFHVRRSVALAVASTGLSVGGIVLTPIIKSLIDSRGLESASPFLAMFWILGTAIPAYLFLRPDPFSLSWMPDGAPMPDNHVVSLPGVNFSDAVKTRFFWMVTFGYTLVLGTQIGAIQQLVKLMEERTNAGTAALTTTVLSGASVVFRLVGGKVIPRFRLVNFMLVITTIQGISVMFIGHLYNTVALFIMIAVFGAMVGNVLIMQSLLIAERFGVKDYARISARSGLVSLTGNAAGPLLLGYVYDKSGGYALPYTIAGACSLVGAAFFLLSGPAENADANTVNSNTAN